MTGGFSFNGIDIADLGLEYAPELENTYVYSPTATNIHEETFEGHDGGYYYGMTKQPKEFTLRCLFEEEQIDHGIMSHIFTVFRKGTSGKLIFQRRQWCYYNVVITEVTTDFHNYLNGLVTIKAKAYYPFARSDLFSVSRSDDDYMNIINNSAALYSSDMVPSPTINCSPNITSAMTIYLFNPGTERAGLGIEIAGDAPSGVYITNRTTGEQCKYIGLTKALTTNKNKYVYTDPINGNTFLKSSSASEMKALYHDYGFLSLEPSFPALRDLFVTSNGTNQITTVNTLYDKYRQTATDISPYFVGKHIYLNNQWIEITRMIDEYHLELKKTVPAAKNQKTMIVLLNEIYIDPVANDMSLTRLNFIYKPTYS